MYLGDTSASRTSLQRFGFDAAGSATYSLYTWGVGLVSRITGIFHRGTSASPAAVQSGDDILRIQAIGYDGVAASNSSARIVVTASENFDATHHGADVEIYATPADSTRLTKIASIHGSWHGNIAAGKEYRGKGSQHCEAAS